MSEPVEEQLEEANEVAEAQTEAEAPAEDELETSADVEGEEVVADEDAVEAQADEDEQPEAEADEDEQPEAEADEDAVEAKADETDEDDETAENADADGEAVEAQADEDDETAEGAADEDDEPAGKVREGMVDVVEALVLASPEPVTVAKVREVYKLEGYSVKAREVKSAFKLLLDKWHDPERVLGLGFTLAETAGGLAFRTAPDTARYVRRLFAERPQRLSRAALETLSIIAYRQPLTKPQVDEIRGVDCGGAIKNLLERKLLRVLGKADDVGRPLLYGTTKTFLEFFGLQSLRDLPTLRQIAELDEADVSPEGDRDVSQAAVVMDLFDPESRRDLVSSQTQAESEDALTALEQALGEATEVVKRASPDKKKKGPPAFLKNKNKKGDVEEPPATPPEDAAEAAPDGDAPAAASEDAAPEGDTPAEAPAAEAAGDTSDTESPAEPPVSSEQSA